MPNSFFCISSHPTRNTVDAQQFLRPQLVPHREKLMLNSFFGIGSHTTENTADAQLFLRSHLLPHKEMLTLVCFFGIGSYPIKNTFNAQLFLLSQLVPNREQVAVQIFLRPAFVTNKESSWCATIFSASTRTSQRIWQSSNHGDWGEILWQVF